MRTLRPVIALDPRLFGRGPTRCADHPQSIRPPVSDDVRLFATSFVVGFLFVAVLIF